MLHGCWGPSSFVQWPTGVLPGAVLPTRTEGWWVEEPVLPLRLGGVAPFHLPMFLMSSVISASVTVAKLEISSNPLAIISAEVGVLKPILPSAVLNPSIILMDWWISKVYFRSTCCTCKIGSHCTLLEYFCLLHHIIAEAPWYLSQLHPLVSSLWWYDTTDSPECLTFGKVGFDEW